MSLESSFPIFFINKYALREAVILLAENQYFFVFYISIDQPNGY